MYRYAQGTVGSGGDSRSCILISTCTVRFEYTVKRLSVFGADFYGIWYRFLPNLMYASDVPVFRGYGNFRLEETPCSDCML